MRAERLRMRDGREIIRLKSSSVSTHEISRRLGMPHNRTVYCASKHAPEGLTGAMGIELGPLGIRANTLCPTFIETPLTKPFFKNEVFARDVLSRIKLRRLGQIEEIIGAVVFLAFDAASLMTGCALMLDGGWTAE